MVVITKHTSRGKTKIQEIIFSKKCSIKSRASYLLMVDDYRIKDVDYISKVQSLMNWLDAREIFLTRRQNENRGNLRCDYCGREHLDIGGKTPEDLKINNKNPNLATVDHIHPLDKDGEKFNEENMAVSCKKCNRRKANKSLLEYYTFLSEAEKGKVSELIKNKL